MSLRDFAAVLIAATAILAASPAPQSTTSTAPMAAAPSPSPLSLGGVIIGRSILDVVQRLGPPDVLRTTDIGHEWQWVDAGGLDREILADDDMIVHQVLVAVPAPLPGQSAPPVVQPSEFPALDTTADDASAAVEMAGGEAIAEPDPTIRAWALSGGVVVAEFESGKVGQLLALDDLSARHLGYLTPPPATTTPFARRAPLMIKEFITPYPEPEARLGIEGTVVIRVLIGADGKAEQTKIVVSSHDDGIDAAAVDSAKRSDYRPAQRDGTPCSGVYFDLQSFTVFHD